jgi:hypothetical protein
LNYPERIAQSRNPVIHFDWTRLEIIIEHSAIAFVRVNKCNWSRSDIELENWRNTEIFRDDLLCFHLQDYSLTRCHAPRNHASLNRQRRCFKINPINY